MKRLLFTALICAAATGVFAQETTKDSVNTSNKKKGVKITLGYGDDAHWIGHIS
jgi:hypothetical protein